VPRNQEVIRQWKVLHALESSRHGVTIDALAQDLDVTTRTIRRDLAAGYASAAWDIRHSLVGSFIYDLPFGKGRRYLTNAGPANWIIGNWQMNSILTFRTGPPFTLGTTQCVGTFGTCQPDVVTGKDPKNAPPGGRRPEEWFDTSAVVAPKPAPTRTSPFIAQKWRGKINIECSPQQ